MMFFALMTGLVAASGKVNGFPNGLGFGNGIGNAFGHGKGKGPGGPGGPPDCRTLGGCGPVECRTLGGCGPAPSPQVDCETLGNCNPLDFTSKLDLKQLLLFKLLLGGSNSGGDVSVCRRELIVEDIPVTTAFGTQEFLPRLFATTCQSGQDAVRNNDGSYRYCGLQRGGQRCPRGTECTSDANGNFYLCCPSTVSMRIPAVGAPSHRDGQFGLVGAAQPGERYIVRCD